MIKLPVLEKDEEKIMPITLLPIPDLNTLRTLFDRDDNYAVEQYQKGLDIGKRARKVYVLNGVWSAALRDGGHLHSCEKIGYHRSTRELLKGFIDSGVEVEWVTL